MKRIMLDTNICIYIIKNRPLHVKKRLSDYSVGDVTLSSVVVSELYFGAYKSEKVEQNLMALEEFLKPFDILEYGTSASKEYGKLRATLERSGTIIGGMDMLIAAHALASDMTLVTNNTKEFKRVEGLRLENWA